MHGGRVERMEPASVFATPDTGNLAGVAEPERGADVTGPCTPVGSLTEEEVQGVLVAATAAPSLHNSQPWRFRCTDATIEVHADLTRELPATDPEHREMMLGCGAALLNLRLAIRMLNVATDVRLLPDPKRPELLAELRPEGFARATDNDRMLAAAITHRHTS